jgi:CubicO group peptidase (beta-lactamase class C family)
VSLPIGLVLAMTPLAASAAPPAAQAPDTATRIDTYLRGRLPQLRTPGISLVVVEGDQVILSRGYGVANRERGVPMSQDTPVLIGSTNKGMVSVAVMQLVEQGLVDLDAPVARYLPDFRMDDERAAAITVRQVLSHTSGIPASNADGGLRDEAALLRELADLANVKLRFAPGTGYEYANAGYAIALLIVQTVSGMPYDEYLRAQVFEPLRMARTTFDRSEAEKWGMTANYAKRRGEVSPGPVAPFPVGGVMTTAGDVGHYFVALLNGGAYESSQVISPASIDQMWTPEPASGSESYGFGWNELHISGMRLLSHAGDIGAGGEYGSSGSQFLIAPERGVAIAVLTNMSSLEKAEIAQDTLAIVLGADPPVRPVAPDWRNSTFAPNRGAWAALVGDYQTSDGVLRVYREGDALLATVLGGSLEFLPQSDTTFIMLSGEFSALDEVAAEFQRQADGSVVLQFMDRPFAVKR